MSSSAYHAYTTKFDAEIGANDLDAILGPMKSRQKKAVEDAWQISQADLLPWKTHLHLLASDADARIRSRLTAEQLNNSTATLLFDQSGSMRGQKSIFCAAAADTTQEFLLTLGISCDILGFTTSRWKRGRARRHRKWRFRPSNPGRLNDLLHIIYRDATDDRISAGSSVYKQMLRPDLPKENIDGEAIQWAAKRLLSRPAARKFLIIVSDGAPMDDSTILQNGPTYLADHLRHVVDEIVSQGQISLASLGIGYLVPNLFPLSRHIEAPSDLGKALISLLEEMLTGR